MAELTYPYAEHVPSGSTQEVAPGVRWLTMPMGGSLNHINLYLLEDSDGWFVVDTGLRNQQTHDLWHTIFDTELGAKPVKGVICTHMHPDHTGMAGMITEHFRAPLLMTRAEFYQARSYFGGGGWSSNGGWQAQEFHKRAGMDLDAMERMRNMWSSRGAQGEGGFEIPELPMSFLRLQDGDLLTIGDHDWHVIVGAGHSPEHACLHCRSLKVLLSGDQILPVITSNVSVHPTEPEANPLKIWMESHDKFLSLPDDILVLPAHNLPFYGVRERLRQLIEHHEDRMLTLEENCVEPRIAVELLPFLFKRDLDQRQMFMALGECIAHLHLLMYRNRIERILGEDGVYRFRSIDPSLHRRMHPQDHDEPDDTPILV